jgi:hypothetical protein
VVSAKKKPAGKCHLCGVTGPLTWEHVPPEAAYNHHPVVRAAQNQMLKPELWDGQRGRKEQRGSGAYTLCARCNNNTGAWYGSEYADWARQGLERLQRIPRTTEDAFFVPFVGHPLRFLKQVITMFFSVNSAEFADLHPTLVKFVLDRDATGLPPEYKVDLVLVRGGLARGFGVHGIVNTETGGAEIASEVAHYPFGLRLIHGEVRAARKGAIEQLAHLGYDERTETWLYTTAGDITTKFPGDYRSRERVERDARTSDSRGA